MAKVWKRIAHSTFPLRDLDADIPPVEAEWHCPDLAPGQAAAARLEAAEEVLCLRNGYPLCGDSKWCGRSTGWRLQLVSLRASWGQDLHARSNPTTQGWPSIRRLAALRAKPQAPGAAFWDKLFIGAQTEELRVCKSTQL